MSRCTLRCSLAIALIVAAVPSIVVAQNRQNDWRLATGGGKLEWASGDTSGTAHTAESNTFVVRAQRELHWGFFVEYSLGYAALEQQLSTTSRSALLDVQLQFETPLILTPYFSVGPSLVSNLSHPNGRRRVEGGFTIGSGLRPMFTRQWGGFLDLRLRGWQPTRGFRSVVNVAGEVTFGAVYRP